MMPSEISLTILESRNLLSVVEIGTREKSLTVLGMY